MYNIYVCIFNYIYIHIYMTWDARALAGCCFPCSAHGFYMSRFWDLGSVPKYSFTILAGGLPSWERSPRWWLQTCFNSPVLGEMIQFDEHIVQMG